MKLLKHPDSLFDRCLSQAIYYLKRSQPSKAIEYIHQAMLLNDSSAKVHNLLGIYYELMGDANYARKHYLISTSLDATYLPATHNLNRIVSYQSAIHDHTIYFD